MQNKQINDTQYHQSSRLSHEPPIQTKIQHIKEDKLKDILYADSMTFNNTTQLQLAQKHPPQRGNQSKQLKPSSLANSSLLLRQQVSPTLPLTIHELSQQTLNQYLRQFMQISTFQSSQKGRQLIDLLKQSPNSKQAQWTVNKLIKLFKSNIPQAVLCSFQFIREMIEIGSEKIIRLFEQALLMQIVDIIEYRSYVKSIQRGNSYFLNNFYRYGSDEKTNHLIKIGQTFFKMIHEAIYVWGNIYFPQSNFNLILNKLINTNKISFPSYPHQFKFYSQTRIQLFLKLIQTKRIKSQQKQILKITRVKKQQSEQKDIERIITPLKLKEKPLPSKLITKKVELRNEQKQQKLETQIPTPIKHKMSLHDEIVKETQQKVTTNKIEQDMTNIKPSRQQNELECIELKKPQLRKQLMQKISKTTNRQQEYKKMKPNRVKQKGPSMPILNRQLQNQISLNFSHWNDIQDPLHLISKQQNIQVKHIKSSLEIMDKQKQQANRINKSVEKISKQSLRINLTKLNNNINHQSITEQYQTAQQITIDHEFNNHTFRPDIQLLKQNNIVESSQRQRYITDQNQHSEAIQTVRIQSTQRQRFNFNYQTHDDLQDKQKHPTYRSSNTSNHFPQPHNIVTEFLKKEFETLKNTLISEIKKDIYETIQSSTTVQNSQHVNFDLEKKIINHEETVQNKDKKLICRNNQTHQKRLVDKQSQSMSPAAQAMLFVKRKLGIGKKLKATSRRRIHSLAKDLQLNDKENQSNPNQQPIIKHQNKSKHKLIQIGVNTDQLTNQKLYEELTSLRKEINLLTSVKQNTTNNFPFSNKKQNAFINNSQPQTKSFYKTLNTINKNQGELEKSSQFSSLRSTSNTLRKRSNSKLSQRRSSAESIIIQKALLKPENCQNQLQQVFGGPNTLLFNAALNSVKKKRSSIMFS